MNYGSAPQAPMAGIAGGPPRAPGRSPFRRLLGPLIFGLVFLGVVAATVYVLLFTSWINPLTATRESAPAENARVIFSGNNIGELRQTRGNVIQQDPSNSSVVWLRSSLTAAKATGATDGVSVAVPRDFAAEARRVRVTVSARGGGGANQAPFALAYSAGSAGNSGWLVFEPTNSFKDFSFNFALPRVAPESNHYVGIWSDITGRGAPLAIRRITITPLP
jgi:hypothetical protein